MHGAGEKLELDEPARAALSSVERLTLERRAGRAVEMSGCDALTWELLLVWEARERQHECLARRGIRELAAAWVPSGKS